MDRYYEEIIDPGDKASALAHEICMRSYDNSPAVNVYPFQPGNFRGPVGFSWKKHILKEMLKNGQYGNGNNWVCLEIPQNDGAGGKPQFFTLFGTRSVFRKLGHEIIAMCLDDIARFGGFSAVFMNDINAMNITKNNFHLFEAMMEGFGDTVDKLGIVNITGEIAIMKHSVTSFCNDGTGKQLVLNWSGACLGLIHKSRYIDGSKIRPKMPIVGFKENGYRCNGGTFFTNLIRCHYGYDPKEYAGNKELRRFVNKLTVPSRIYGKTLERVNGWAPDGSFISRSVNLSGIAHITGGGIWEKFGKLLPKGVGAKLDKMPLPPEVLLEAQAMSKSTPFRLSDLEAYRTLHGGCGMLMVCGTEKDAELLIREAKKDKIEALVVGETISSVKSEILINSRFADGRVLSSLEL
jgi:phosphoribosylformylglycinamidine cyclo-ligase